MSHNIHAQRKEQKIRNITRSKERKTNISNGGRKLNAATHSRSLPTTHQGCQNTRTLHGPQHKTCHAGIHY